MTIRKTYMVLTIALIAFMIVAVRNLLAWRHVQQRTQCIEQLADIEGAKEQYAIEHDGAVVNTIESLVPRYLNTVPSCPAKGRYTLGDLQNLVTCSVDGHAIDW